MVKIKLLMSILLLLSGFILYATETLEPEFRIRGNKAGNLWSFGDTVNFRALPLDVLSDNMVVSTRKLTAYRKELAAGKAVATATMPADWVGITGTVFDYHGIKIAEHAVDTDTFSRSGWSWKPAEPGFYSIIFTAKSKFGEVKTLSESMRSGSGWTVKIPPAVIQRKVHDFAVLTPAPVGRGVGFGLSLRPVYRNEEALKMIPMIGFEYVRFHYIPWYQMEKTKGKIDWGPLDATVKMLRQLGIKHFAGNIWGTPKWASSNPDAPGKSIRQDYYAAYAPAKLSNYSDFQEALIRRYPDIKYWEVWNEPHFPGQSIFWRSSPEEFVKLQKTAYATIKKLQPDATVWIGGMGMRYLQFYHKIMELGVGNSFDVLPLHGRDIDPEPFNEVNRQFGIKPKPWVNGEWHAVLYKTGSNAMPSEARLAYNMMLDLLESLRNKVSKVTVWAWTQGTEREFIEHFRKHGEKAVSIGGMLRVHPCYEPRMALAVLSAFINNFSGQISFLAHYAFADRLQQAALLESNGGKILYFWQNSDKPLKPAPQLAVMLQKGEVRSWDGRKVKANASFMMRPSQMYMLKSPDARIIAKWTKINGKIVAEKKIVLNRDVYGNYESGRLFDSQMNIIANQQHWHSINRFITMPGKTLSGSVPEGKFALAFSDEGMDLLVEIKDHKHVQNYPQKKIWDGDSVQFAIDAAGKGRSEDRILFNAALAKTGPLLMKHCAPAMIGDLPARYTYPPGEVKYGKIAIEQQPGMLIYKIHISRDDLYSFVYQKGKPIRFSLLVNDNNGDGRKGYLEWSSGIGRNNAPEQYGTMTPYIKSKKIAGQKDLTFKGGGTADLGSVIAKVNAPNGSISESLRTPLLKLTEGTAYHISFSAKGNMKIRAFAGIVGNDGKTTRMNLIKPQTLVPSSWRTLEHTFIVPKNTRRVYICIFSWNEHGFFEVKDFSLKSGLSK